MQNIGGGGGQQRGEGEGQREQGSKGSTHMCIEKERGSEVIK